MSFTPQRAQESVQATTPTSEVTEFTLGPKGKDGEAVQPLVSEIYADEKEQRLAEFVFSLEKERADANGGNASKKKDSMLSGLTDVMEQVSLPIFLSLFLSRLMNLSRLASLKSCTRKKRPYLQ
jgi:hypothetical protein